MAVSRWFFQIFIQCSNERKKLKIESVKCIIMVKYNFKHMRCEEFHEYLSSRPNLLRKI